MDAFEIPDVTKLPAAVRSELVSFLDEYRQMNAQPDPRLTPEGVARRTAQLENQIRITLRYAEEAEPIIAELQALGLQITKLQELGSSKTGDRRSVPTLVRWFPKIVGAELKMDLAAILGRSWAQPDGVAALISELPHINPSLDRGLDSVRGRVADALDKSITDKSVDSTSVKSLIRFVQDKHQGLARGFVVMALGKLTSHKRQLVPVLVELLDDETMLLAAVVALGRLKASEAEDAVKAHLSAQVIDPSMRAHVKKALAQMAPSATS